MNIDIISDVHVSHWVNPQHPVKKQRKNFHILIEKILPDSPSDVLIIACDIGHYNRQDLLFMEIVKEYYKQVLWTHGNHDLYLTSKSMQKHYKWDSFNRLNEKIEMYNAIDGVEYLNGNIVDIDGIKIGGCSMWYNNDYAKKKWANMEWTMLYGYEFITKKWGESDKNCLELFNMYLNDSEYVLRNQKSLNYLEYFEEQKKLMESIHRECNVIVSHIGPSWDGILDKWKIPPTTFYYFDGKEFLNNLKKDAVWVYGHTHDRCYYKHSSGCYMACNPLDYGINYPNWISRDDLPKIINIEVGKVPGYDEIFKNTN